MRFKVYDVVGVPETDFKVRIVGLEYKPSSTYYVIETIRGEILFYPVEIIDGAFEKHEELQGHDSISERE